jgi:hypothetical protein
VTDCGRECEQPLMEIDNRGTRLRGCMTCNIWLSADDKKVGLSEEDLAGAACAAEVKGADRSRRPERLRLTVHRLVEQRGVGVRVYP